MSEFRTGYGVFDSSTVKPMGDYVLLETDPDTIKSKGGILLAPIADEQKMYATVRALPDPVPSFIKGVNIGDRVLFAKGSRNILAKDPSTGSELIMVPFLELLCVIEE